MKNRFIYFLIFLCSQAQAQEPAPATPAAVPELPPASSQQFPNVRPKPPEDPNKESSSFVGDPENLDPLKARRENLKDENEPVLEDIKQVIDAPSPQKEIKKEVIKKAVIKKSPSKKLPPKKTAQVKRKIKKEKVIPELMADEPDSQIENRFYQNYLRYNTNPTSEEAWSSATFGRSSEVYIVQKGDTLWTISETLFGDSLFWPKIWAINRQGILNPHFITPGMQVHFYPGSSENVPTLAVGQEQLPSDRRSEKLEPGQGQVYVSESERPTGLPPSMPVYRSGLYYGKSRKIEMIDLEEPEKMPLTYSTDILITDRIVLSDIDINPEGNATLSCFKGEVVEQFSYNRRVKTKEYAILQPLEKIELEKSNYLYPYQRVGTLSSYDNGKLKIKECNSYLNKDQVFVPVEILSGLKTNKSSVASAKIIGGPDVIGQQNYTPSQTVYVDMGANNFEVGQLFEVKSRRIDSGVGKIKILDRFGSYAVAVIVDSQNSIQSGDAILPQ